MCLPHLVLWSRCGSSEQLASCVGPLLLKTGTEGELFFLATCVYNVIFQINLVKKILLSYHSYFTKSYALPAPLPKAMIIVNDFVSFYHHSYSSEEYHWVTSALCNTTQIRIMLKIVGIYM